MGVCMAIVIEDLDRDAGSGPSRVIDASGLQCIQLLLRLRAESGTLPAGTVVEVISTDPASVFDLPAWCHLIGHEHLRIQQGEGTYLHSIRLSDRPVVTRAGAPWHA